MRIVKIVSTIFLILGLLACSSSKRTYPEPAETWNLLVDDEQGVVFTAYDFNAGTPVQFKFYDPELKIILNDETFPGTSDSSTYALEYVKSQLVIFGLNYNGETINEIFCDCDKSDDTSKQLHFEDDDTGDDVIDGDDTAGIFWTDLITIAEAPILEDHTFVCTSGDRTFYIEVFKNNGLCDERFTLYFDFLNLTFRGKLVVTDVSYENRNDPDNDSVILWFE